MKKYILTPVTQKNHTFYSMVADPREIVTAVKRAEAEEAQENQRPWSKKKVLEIVEYVMGRLTLDKQKFSVNGLIPNAPIINKEDNLTFALSNLIQNGFQSLLKFTTEFCACN